MVTSRQAIISKKIEMRNILLIGLIIIGAGFSSCDEGPGEYPEGGMIPDGYAYLTDCQND